MYVHFINMYTYQRQMLVMYTCAWLYAFRLYCINEFRESAAGCQNYLWRAIRDTFWGSVCDQCSCGHQSCQLFSSKRRHHRGSWHLTAWSGFTEIKHLNVTRMFPWLIQLARVGDRAADGYGFSKGWQSNSKSFNPLAWYVSSKYRPGHNYGVDIWERGCVLF
jgi:hypothetical protein